MRYTITLILFLELLARPVGQSALPPAFEAFLDAVDRAQVQLQNGDATTFKALWAQSDEVTLAGGFGGPVSKGWQQVSYRLDAVGRQFSGGRHQTTRIVASASADLGYVVQLEHVDYRVPGQAADSSRDYRVTMIFKRESAGWRLVHRQADTLLTNQMTR
jgi:ketosteroid isomerase-like protein